MERRRGALKGEGEMAGSAGRKGVNQGRKEKH